MKEKPIDEVVSKNTMHKVPIQIEEAIKRQVQCAISDFFLSYRDYEPWHNNDDYFIPYEEGASVLDPEPYEFYMKGLRWSDDMVNDVANCLLQQMINRFTDLDIQSRMAKDPKVLIDDEKSMRWLCRIAKAERTSVNYERGIRLVDEGKNIYHNVIACAIMQKAADSGDEDCAMYLIDKTLNQQRANASKLQTPSLQCAYGVVYAEIGDAMKAKDILQKMSDDGDDESAMYLISQTLSKMSKGSTTMDNNRIDVCDSYRGLIINWDNERIFDFLLRRYDKGDIRAKELLKQLLRLTVDAEVGDCEDKYAARTQKVKEVKGYPLTVIQEILHDDYCNKPIEITSYDSDDLPF
jgi:hypothetical protein